MFCPHCGRELPAEASFCPHCGRAQRFDSADAGMTWETCEILYAQSIRVLITCRFWARALGPQGEFCAGESASWTARYPASNDPEALIAHRQLVQRLLAAGWKPVGRGFLWYNDRFERRSLGNRASVAQENPEQAGTEPRRGTGRDGDENTEDEDQP